MDKSYLESISKMWISVQGPRIMQDIASNSYISRQRRGLAKKSGIRAQTIVCEHFEPIR